MMEIECVSYKHIGKGVIMGYAHIFIPSWEMDIYNIQLCQKNGKRWINFPSREVTDESGNIKYFPYFRIRNPQHFGIFSEKVKKAIDEHCLSINRSVSTQEATDQKDYE